tara:strand:- start:5118 stop:6302 length:1185 start_codon:yes stop_codon:yes gene_type:complete
MAVEIRSAPSSRFPAFSGNWKPQRLDDFFSSSRAKGSEGLPTLSVTLNQGLVNRDDLARKQETNLTAKEHLLVRDSDIAYNMMRMWQGAFGRATYNGIVSPAYVVLRAKKGVDTRFFEYAFRKERSIYLFWAYSYGLTNDRLRLYANDFCRIPFSAPTFPEQRKIAIFLTAVDQRIQQLIKKKALLEDYKKGVMQQLFNQAIRFKDANGKDFPDWEENEFELIAEKSKAKHNPTKSEEEWECVELESLSQNTGNLLETFSSSKQKSIKNKFSAGEVLFGKLRPYLRKFLHADFNGVCSSEIWVLNGKTVTNHFLFQLIQTHKFNQAANVSSGSKMPRADWDFLSSVPFHHPASPDEQNKVADFLSAIDRKIESVATQITETQTFKKGLLQQMFI